MYNYLVTAQPMVDSDKLLPNAPRDLQIDHGYASVTHTSKLSACMPAEPQLEEGEGILMNKGIHRLVISVCQYGSGLVFGIVLLILAVSNQRSFAANSNPSQGKSVNNVFLPYVSKPCPFTLDQIEIIYVRNGYNHYDKLLGTKLDTACSIEFASIDAIWGSKPAWSPDGSKIAYMRGGEIFVLELNRLGEINITNDSPTFDDWHSWSPSGEKIAFTKIVQGSGFRTDIYVVNADGSGGTNLTSKPEYYQYLSWSPDSNQMVFECENGICVMNADGTGRRDLVRDEFFPGAGSPDWSPTSNKIAFAAGTGGDREIFIINYDGTGFQKLTADQRINDLPIWSPDGIRIAFQSDLLDVYSGDIFIINGDGTGLINLTDSPEFERNADWSPDGKKIAFEKVDPASNISNIYVINLDGSGLIQLTDLPAGGAIFPAWRP